ncbi:MAG: DUF4595 domain-containing protein [Duncaniella sp.]|nr:DUF4595 domain-containing protein [Duncaniella sp.]
MTISFFRFAALSAIASMMIMTTASCSSDDDDHAPEQPEQPATPKGTNAFAAYGELKTIKYATSNGNWSYTTPKEYYKYSFDKNSLVSCVTGANSGQRNPITYEKDRIIIRHNDGAEGEYTYYLENGRITSCSREGMMMYLWEYDETGRVVRAVSLLTNGGIANAYLAKWNASGDLVEVVCEEVSDYEGGRENFGDRVTFTFSSTPMTNPIVLQIPLQRPAAATVLSLKINPLLLAEGYYGNTAPRHLPESKTEYDASKSTTLPSKITDYRYTLDEEGRVTRMEQMYIDDISSGKYHYGSCHDYIWR